MAVSKVSRKVYFFRVGDQADILPKLQDTFAHIGSLPFNDQGRYQSSGADDTVLAIFVTQPTFPIQIQFARIRRDNLPLVERAGDITPLSLDEDAGLMDWSHIVIFEDGIVAAEFVQDAPRIRRLGQYLFFKATGMLETSPKFLPLFQRNVLDELESFDSISILELEAATSDAEQLAEADAHIGAAFKACRQAGGVRRSQIVLKAQGSLSNNLKQLARKLFTNAISRESLLKLKVHGRSDGDRKPLDLLEEYLITTESFVRIDPRFKAVDPADAFRVIMRAYEANKGKFADAVTAAGPWS